MNKILVLLLICAYVYAFDFLPKTSKKDNVVHHFAYTLYFDNNYKDARWVAYMLTQTNLLTILSKRSNNFRPDPSVPNSPTPQDYTRSGYDRGHLAPAADFRWNEQAMNESFYMSNMTPQIPAFNRGIWNNLEKQVRDWALEKDTLYIVTGAVLHKGLPTIGTSNVTVPERFYKVILQHNSTTNSGVGFVIPNEGSTEPLESFEVTIDSVEHITGLDFFPALPDSIERKVEGRIGTGWFH
jgi:endonuclease G